MSERRYERLTEEQLLRRMDGAYSRQAYVVDNGGSDDASYEAERTCDELEAELRVRGLWEKYSELEQPNGV